MGNHKIFAIIFTLLSSLSLNAIAKEEIRWIAQDYPPYSYINKAGENSGLTVEIASKIMKNIGSENNQKNIEVRKFSKFFVFRNDDTNTVFFPIAKTPNRASKFKWVGPIITPKTILIAKKSKNIKINNPSSLSQYSIGTMSGFYAVSDLTTLGVDSGAFQSMDNDKENLKELSSGKVDVALCDELSCNFSIKALNLNPNDFETIYTLKSSDSSFYFAFASDTKDDVINKTQKAFDDMKLRKNGKESAYELIVKKYVK